MKERKREKERRIIFRCGNFHPEKPCCRFDGGR